MRIAKPNELKTHAYPVLAAAITPDELSKWFPISFQHITDAQEVPEPSKAAVIQLDDGSYAVIYYGELSNQLTLRIPTSVEAPAFLSALFKEVPLPKARIVWRRQDAVLPANVAARSLRLPRAPKKH
ncbi:MAG TPA: hypothetical protein VGJ82_05100 [Thermoanaerobaculia bacterium]|jgi:hypothetical protein